MPNFTSTTPSFLFSLALLAAVFPMNAADPPYIWNSDTSGLWSDPSNWDNSTPPPLIAPAAQIHLTRNQTTPALITIDPSGATIGNLTIGAPAGNFTLSGGTLTFDNLGNTSRLVHSANSNTDTLASAINLANDLIIDARSPNALNLNGTLTAATKNLTLTSTTAGGLLHLNNTLSIASLSIAGGITIRHNHTAGNNGISTANLTITNSTFIQDNALRNGIHISGALDITGGNFVNNTTRGNGINSAGKAPINITDSRFHNNYSARDYASNTGIRNAAGNFTITNSTFTNNAAGYGNAIYTNGHLQIIGGTFTNNVTNGNGINSDTNSNISITSANFTNNYTAGSYAIYNTSGILDITDSLFTNNARSPGTSIYLNGHLNITRGTFTNNATAGTAIDSRPAGNITIRDAIFHNLADGDSTAIDNTAGTFTIEKSTFTNNATGAAYGIHNLAGNITLSNSTLINSAHDDAYAIYTTGTLTLANSTLVNNAHTAGNAIHVAGNLTISNTQIIANTTRGNGIYNAPAGNLSISGSTIINNFSGSTGSYGIHDAGGTFTIANSTITNNATGNGVAFYTNGNLLLTDSTIINNAAPGDGAALYGDTHGNITLIRSTLVTTGHPAGNDIYTKGTLTLGESSRILNDTQVGTSGIPIRFTGGNQLLAGNGTYAVPLAGLAPTTRISPGGRHDPATGNITHTIGTLTLQGPQSWTQGFIYEWQLDPINSSSDLLALNSTLNLNNGTFTLAPTALAPFKLPTRNYTWTLLSAAAPITNLGNFTILNPSTFLNSIGLLGNLTVALTNPNTISLQFTSNPTYYWKAHTNDYRWFRANNWETQQVPSNPGDIACFTRDQDGTVSIRTSRARTVGFIYIGSENGTSTTSYIINDPIPITLDTGNPSIAARITHLATANTDTINANLTLTNDLIIDVRSKNELIINGNFTIPTTVPNALLITGPGNLTLNTHTAFDSNITIAAHHTTLNGTLSNNGNITIDPGAQLFLAAANLGSTDTQAITFKTNSTLIGEGNITAAEILFESQITIRAKRLGAKYHDTFNWNGNTTLNGGQFHLPAEFQPTAGTSTIYDQTATIFVDGTLTLNPAAEYTINLYNTGIFEIIDWTQSSPGQSLYYSLITATGGIIDNGATFNINWGLNPPPIPAQWSIIIAYHEGIHGIWLHYSTPARIPEPATCSLLLAAPTLLLIPILRRKNNSPKIKNW